MSQELDMQVINFIVTCLLPNSADVQLAGFDSQRTFEQSLVQMIDSGCQNTLQLQIQSQNGAVASLSRYCFNNLFDLCRYQDEVLD